MRVLVTGAAGYIGSHLCKILSERGHTVVGVDIVKDHNNLEKYCTKIHYCDIMNNNRIGSF